MVFYELKRLIIIYLHELIYNGSKSVHSNEGWNN